MPTHTANGDSPLSFWPRVREFAVPPSMIETATARRLVGDWAGACAAAGIDTDLGPRTAARTHGRELAAQLRSDLRQLAPDLLRWHMPRIAPDGLLRPGLTLTLARYDGAGRDGRSPVHLVARTPPAWADAGQRISLALWDGSRSGADTGGHPHPRPSRRFRLDLHRHLWDAGRSGELRMRAGADRPTVDDRAGTEPEPPLPEAVGMLAHGLPCAVDRWAAEAGILLRAEGRAGRAFVVRLGGRRRLVLELAEELPELADLADLGDLGGGFGPSAVRLTTAAPHDVSALPVLPDAATWVPPDLELVRTGAIDVDRLHPLVAAALVPDPVRDPAPTRPYRSPEPAGQPRFVECRGARHRIGLVDGVLAPLDHDPAEIRREELLASLTGTPLPCLQAIDRAHRRPDCLTGVRERLDHGDIAGALAVVEGLLGPDAVLRDGALRDELAVSAERRIAYGLFRAGLIGPGPGLNSGYDTARSTDPATDPGRPDRHGRRHRARRPHPRHVTAR
ncbi:hypothetical protein OK074_0749 [Actinobacteria bacterium OK074]|nr:hypothetical protein OK074_0749 [Actinobacteria bacterium OK074]